MLLKFCGYDDGKFHKPQYTANLLSLLEEYLLLSTS
jgi:hypothetical protein